MAFNLSLKKHSVIPGFGLTMGFTLFYLSVVVLFPLAVMVFKTTSLTWGEIVDILGEKRVVHAFEVTFGISFLAALVNAVFGTIVAWVLVRYDFFGKKIIDGLVDTPFAIPTAVSGIALATLYSENGWIGSLLIEYGIKIAFNPWGIGLALVFIGFPFVVRTLQPVMEDMSKEVEEAAASLGANRFQVVCKVILPQLYPALLTGFVMAFARALGEYGSVIFIAGNIPEVSEIVPLIIMIKLEQYDYIGATVVGVGSLVASFVLILILNFLQKWSYGKTMKASTANTPLLACAILALVAVGFVLSLLPEQLTLVLVGSFGLILVFYFLPKWSVSSTTKPLVIRVMIVLITIGLMLFLLMVMPLLAIAFALILAFKLLRKRSSAK